VNAKQAWLLLAAGVFSYEIYCKDGELLSDGVDEWLVSKPVLTRAIIAALALHLANALPVRYDVVSLGFIVIRKASRWWRQRSDPAHSPFRWWARTAARIVRLP
jgi:hypothetical protein